jgi:hypothetical protein
MNPPAKCKHCAFDCNVDINRLEDIGRFVADVTIKCAECGVPFRFLGLPIGLDINSAMVSPDGTEARMGVAPRGESVPEAKGVEGFAVKQKGIP